MLRIMQLVGTLRTESDGVAVCAKKLSLSLNRVSDLEVHAISATDEIRNLLNTHTYKGNHLPRILKPLGGIGISSEMKNGVRAAAGRFDIIHAHCLWMQLISYAEKAKRGRNVKLVIQPHGTMSKWAMNHSRLKKLFSLYLLGQHRALKRADMLVASCREEYDDIRRYGLKQPVAIIPNGIEIPTLPKNIIKKRKLVFLSRIHQKKGLDLLLRAWQRLLEKFPEWELHIAGNNQNEYGDYLAEFAKANECHRIEFVGEIKGIDKYRFLSEASLYVLPTHSENFGLAVGEALACGTPVVTTTGAPWSGLVDNGCGLWIDLSVENLTRALEDMMSRPLDELARMGQNGRRWMQRDFSWDEIAQKTIQSYQWLLDQENVMKPDWIFLD